MTQDLWDSIMSSPQAEYPDPLVVRFVARNFYDRERAKVTFLDLGCGTGVHTAFLADKGFKVCGIDFSEAALAQAATRAPSAYFVRDDINSVLMGCGFDCILDYNTLCHVEHPPFKKIRDALKPDGIFFSVAPTHDTWKGTVEGKGYCRLVTELEMRELLSDFSQVRIGKACYPDQGYVIKSWVIEARP